MSEEKNLEVVNLEVLLMDLEKAKEELLKTNGYTKEADIICFIEELVKEQGTNEDIAYTAS